MKNDFLYKVSLRLLPFLVIWLTRILFATCRITTHGQQFRDQITKRNVPYVAAFWHYTFMFIFYCLRGESGVVMVSGSKDGEYISRLAQKLGYETVRGSKKKGGMLAIKGLIRHVRKGENAGIVADGSQGPPRIVQAGCIVLASLTGSPVLPMLWSCNRYKRFGSWDGTAIPLPFSRIDFFYGEPLDVPSKLKADEIEEYRVVLENRLNDLYTEAWAIQGKKEH